MGNPVGRPLKFQTKEELDQKIDEYFEVTPKEEWTWTGLALHLDTSRTTLLSYQDRPEFIDSIKKGLEKVENSYELDLKKHGRTGTIFALKNFNWKDKSEIDQTIKLPTPILGGDNVSENNSSPEDTEPN